ncbi:hypothetical protein E2562_012874, partial [Oryza meyeriana var. granulata]
RRILAGRSGSFSPRLNLSTDSNSLFPMEAAIASTGSGLLRSSPKPPARQQRSARVVGFASQPQPRAVRCKRSTHPAARACAAAARAGAMGGSVGMERKRLAVFVSGGGSNFRAIHDAALGGKVNADVVALVTDKPGCGGAEHARGNGVPVVVFPKSKSAPAGVSTDELLNTLSSQCARTLFYKTSLSSVETILWANAICLRSQDFQAIDIFCEQGTQS